MKSRGNWLFVRFLYLAAVFMLACTSGVAPTAKPTTTPAAKTTLPAAPASTLPTTTASFAGKTITLVVPSAAGGATDLAGRLYARFLPKYLPGNPVIVVRNLPAGEGTVAVNSFYLSAKPDGLTILIGVSKASLGQLMGSTEAKYDFMKMPVLIAVANGIGYYMRPGIVNRPEELLKAKGIIFGYSSGAGA